MCGGCNKKMCDFDVKNIELPELSNWECELFGIKNGITLRPNKGCVPNWFHRLMQRLILGNKWRKVKDTCQIRF